MGILKKTLAERKRSKKRKKVAKGKALKGGKT